MMVLAALATASSVGLDVKEMRPVSIMGVIAVIAPSAIILEPMTMLT